MKKVINPPREEWTQLCQRPEIELDFLESSVRNIINRVKKSGDEALRALTLQYDKVAIDGLKVSKQEIDTAVAQLDPNLKIAIQTAAKNIEIFHAAQSRENLVVETMPGITCWRKILPIEKVGIYIPGGSAPLFSTVLMLGVPARLAGCREVILCSPPDASGKINAAILFAASLTGISTIFKVGGAQAIAAMAFGTESIPPVNKIFGPGNQFVTKAKQAVTQEGIAIDLPAGPSEVLVIADEAADAAFVAADLLSQAEHGADSQVVLVTTSQALVERVQKELTKQLAALPRKEVAQQSLENSLMVQFSSMDEVFRFSNEYAPEHLIINTTDADQWVDKIVNSGSVFVGGYTPEAAGDYASGTNHTLPTGGYAKAYSGVSLESFQKHMTVQKITKEGLKTLGPVVIRMAEAEQLQGHAEAIRVRMGK